MPLSIDWSILYIYNISICIPVVYIYIHNQDREMQTCAWCCSWWNSPEFETPYSTCRFYYLRKVLEGSLALCHLQTHRSISETSRTLKNNQQSLKSSSKIKHWGIILVLLNPLTGFLQNTSLPLELPLPTSSPSLPSWVSSQAKPRLPREFHGQIGVEKRSQ